MTIKSLGVAGYPHYIYRHNLGLVKKRVITTLVTALMNFYFQPGDVVPCIEDLLLAVFQLQLVRTLRESCK